MIMTRKEILKEIKKHQLIIEPLDQAAIGPASIDLTLSSRIRVFKNDIPLVSINEQIKYEELTEPKEIKQGYDLKPKQLILGITEEKITLPEYLCGWINSRSKFARAGLMSHITAPFICPGVSNRQVLEIYNAGPATLRLLPGAKICQIILQECKGEARYCGIFQDQTL